tara:strand:+ start:1437 stop:2567 length:1131 start_codon:yes stop_codon:yes gene_type:complete
MLFKILNKFFPKILNFILIFLKRNFYNFKKSESILFIVEFPQSFSSFNSIISSFNRFSKGNSIEILILSESNYNKLNNLNFDNLYDRNSLRIIKVEDLKPYYKYIFIHNPYDVERPKNLSFQNLYFKCKKIIYLSYGIEIAGGRKLTQFNMPSQRYSNYIFVHSHSAKNQYKKYCSTGDNHVYPTGHPSFDEISFNSKNVKNDFFLWCPHHSVSKENNDLSTFLLYEDKIFKYFQKNSSKKLCIRPHPMLIKKLNDLGSKYSKKYSQLISLNNVFEDKSNNYIKTFEKSIALMTDASSFLMIYPLINKPMLYLKNKNGPELGDDGFYFKNSTAHNWSDIHIFLENDYSNKRYYINLKNEILNIGSSGKEIVKFLMK